MKKIFVLIVLGFSVCSVYSKDKNDPIVMTIAGKEIPLSEFIFLAQKDSGVNLLNKKSLKSYVELFKNFKLKVAAAEELKIVESKNFKDELANYESQLKENFLLDKEAENAAVRKMYDRGENLLSVSHILFRTPAQFVSKDTVEVYNRANEVYQKILKGGDFTQIGKQLASEDSKNIMYDEIEYLLPLEAFKSFENAVYSLSSLGEISRPVRSDIGFHLIRLDNKTPNPGQIRVAQILIGSIEGSNETDDEALLKQANEVYEKAIKGEDFAELAKEFSADKNSALNGGLVPYFGLGQMVKPFEKAAFALSKPGEISKPVKTRFGYHIIKFLDKKERSFEELEKGIYLAMKQGEWNFELYEGFDEKVKEKRGYKMNQDAYNDFQRLCNDYFPTDTMFYNQSQTMKKVLMQMDNQDFPQDEFGEYVKMYPYSTKAYAGDFLYDVYRMFVRDIATELERRYLENESEEYKLLVKEFHDGILLFEISNEKIWEKPLEQQPQLEKEWIKELNQKYETKINWDVLNNIKKYLN